MNYKKNLKNDLKKIRNEFSEKRTLEAHKTSENFFVPYVQMLSVLKSPSSASNVLVFV